MTQLRENRVFQGNCRSCCQSPKKITTTTTIDGGNDDDDEDNDEHDDCDDKDDDDYDDDDDDNDDDDDEKEERQRQSAQLSGEDGEGRGKVAQMMVVVRVATVMVTLNVDSDDNVSEGVVDGVSSGD